MYQKLIIGAAALALAAGGTTWAATGAGASTQGGSESFTLVETSGSDNGTIILRGAFSDGGTDISKNGRDRLRLGQGAFTISHPDSDSDVSFHLNPTTCAFSLKGTGPYTLGQGTRAYRGISGSGTYRIQGQGIAARDGNGQCDPNAEPTTYIDVIRAHGPVSFDGSGES